MEKVKIGNPQNALPDVQRAVRRSRPEWLHVHEIAKESRGKWIPVTRPEWTKPRQVISVAHAIRTGKYVALAGFDARSRGMTLWVRYPTRAQRAAQENANEG